MRKPQQIPAQRGIANWEFLGVPGNIWQLTIGALAMALASPHSHALPPQALAKKGACPSGYLVSGNYCMPSARAAFAVQKVGACPNGYQTSGDYCLAGSQARHALVLAGACPGGYAVSGAYCLQSARSQGKLNRMP